MADDDHALIGTCHKTTKLLAKNWKKEKSKPGNLFLALRNNK